MIIPHLSANAIRQVAFVAIILVPCLGGCASMNTNTLEPPKDRDYYQADGSFDAEAAKAAYYALMDHHGYPIPDRLRGEDFWTLDFGLGKFSEVGMAGVFWINQEQDDYMGHEIFLLPGQMIPEHWHLKTAKARPKMEGWHLRHGSVTLFSEGTPTPGIDEKIPSTHRQIAVARTAQVLKPGEVGYLSAAGSKHWMLAGPEGAIVSEYASFHDSDGLRFTHPDVKF